MFFLKRLVPSWAAIEKRMLPAYVWESDPLTFWQERILFIMCFIAGVCGPVALIPSLTLAYLEGLWNVILLDAVVYGGILLVLLKPQWPLKLRAGVACLTLYGLAVGLLCMLGPVGAGYVWLFGTSVMISTIIGLRAAVGTTVLNAVALLGVALFVDLGKLSWALPLEHALQKWLVMTVNFLVLNTFVTITTAIMLNGLKRALLNEQEISASLRQSEERYRIVSDFTHDWEYWIGPEGDFRYVSPSCEEMTGYPVDAFLRDAVLLTAIVHEADRDAVAQHLHADTQRGETVAALDFRIRAKDGQIKWISHYCQPVFSDEALFLGRRVSNRDITDRKLVEEKLRMHHERFLTVLESIDATIYVADMQSHEILFVNKQMIQRLGKDATGDICWRVFRGESGPCGCCTNPRLLNGRGEPTGVQVWHERNPITGRWTVNYDRAIKWIDGRLVKIQIATDITEFKKMEAELRQAQKMEAIGTLAGGIAHDFNNILSSILGYTELALDDAAKGTLLEDNLHEVLTAGKRARDLIQQILAFARRSDERLKPVQLRAIALEALKMIRSSIPSTIAIHQNLTSAASILGNPTQVHRLLINLCTNAAHAMEAGSGTLRIDLTDVRVSPGQPAAPAGLAPGDYLKLAVADTGTGIAPEILGSIFEPYFTTKGPGQGTGMGLAMVHGIVESYGGKILVESAVGRGTTFSIYLPAAGTPAETQPVDEEPPSADDARLPLAK
jgi:PAS domain S-box-containing protein